MTCPRKAPAWKLVALVANQCLSYDATVLSPELCAPLGATLDSAVLAATACILDCEGFSARETGQLRLGRFRGGCEIRSAAERCATSFLATALRLSPVVLTGPAAATAIADCQTCIEQLEKLGICIDAVGMAHALPCSADRLDLRNTTQPMTHRQRGWWTAIDRARVAALPRDEQDRLESCAGPEGGAYLSATRTELGCSLRDAEFTSYTRLRLGMPVMRAGPCQHARANADGGTTACGSMADADGRHCMPCKVGGAVLAAHGEGCQVLADACRDAGFICRKEQIIPELATTACPSPKLDLDAFGVVGADRLLIDFTLRMSTAARYGHGARSNAAASGEADKQARYPPAGGISVRGAGMEVLGRHGPGLASLLEELADRARLAAVHQGRPPARFLRLWRCRLSGVAARLVGRAVVTGSGSARPWFAWECDRHAATHMRHGAA